MGIYDAFRADLERKKQEMNMTVRIALIGQPGAGKSSLINRLIGKKIFETGERTDTTIEKQEAQFNHLNIVDLPGYGTKRFPIDQWLEEFKPEDFDLYLFVFSGKLHDSDGTLFQCLEKWRNERRHPYFIVRNKEDQIWDESKSLDDLKKEIEHDVRTKMKSTASKVYFVSCRIGTGIDILKNDILASDITSVKKSKLIFDFKASSKKDLDSKKAACLDDLDYYAWAGAANGGLNILPGVDVGVDIGIILKMFSDYRNAFGLDEETKSTLDKFELIAPAIRKVFDCLNKEGIALLIKELGGRFAEKEAGKYIPLLGNVASAILGYKMIYALGEKYIDECYELAEIILENVTQNG